MAAGISGAAAGRAASAMGALCEPEGVDSKDVVALLLGLCGSPLSFSTLSKQNRQTGLGHFSMASTWRPGQHRSVYSSLQGPLGPKFQASGLTGR